MPKDPILELRSRLLSCQCMLCRECPYQLHSRVSRDTKRCFSCRKGVHAGASSD